MDSNANIQGKDETKKYKLERFDAHPRNIMLVWALECLFKCCVARLSTLLFVRQKIMISYACLSTIGAHSSSAHVQKQTCCYE